MVRAKWPGSPAHASGPNLGKAKPSDALFLQGSQGDHPVKTRKMAGYKIGIHLGNELQEIAGPS